MPKSRSGQLFDCAAQLRFTPFFSLTQTPDFCVIKTRFTPATSTKRTTFACGRFFVRSALFSHRLEQCVSHDLQPTSERSERPTTSGVTPPSSGVTHSRFRASCLPYQCVTNRAVSTAYPICTPLPPFFRKIRCTDPSRWQKIKSSISHG